MLDGPFDLATRHRSLDALRRGCDVLVVGGGVTGCGVALDAAARGLRVGLVERGDLAEGTSSRSSRLVHGGLRYLAHGDLALVAEGLAERAALRRLAPSLVRPQPFVVPSTRDRVRDGILLAGIGLYGLLSAGRRVGPSRPLPARAVAELIPPMVDGHRWGLQYHDCRTDDARLTLAAARAAARAGARVATRVEAVGLLGHPRQVAGVEAVDRLSGERLELPARSVVVAGGVWTGEVADDPDQPLTAARGSHLVLPDGSLGGPLRAATVVPSAADDGRGVFLLPWGGQVVVGTTDGPHAGALDEPAVGEQEAAYLLDAVDAAFGIRLDPDDAVGAWSGLRPLAAAGDGSSADLSRRHLVRRPRPGLVTITGGKLTTFRRMAADAVAACEPELGRLPPSGADRIPLAGRADGPVVARRLTSAAGALGVRLSADVAAALALRHGDAAADLLVRAADDDELDLLVPGLPYLAAEVRWAVRHEMALDVTDVLRRRLPVALRSADGGRAAAGLAASVLGDEHGWDAAERDRRVRAHLRAVAAERGPVPLTG